MAAPVTTVLNLMVAHELAGERRRRVEREPHGGVRAFGDVARGVEAAHVGLHPAGADRFTAIVPASSAARIAVTALSSVFDIR